MMKTKLRIIIIVRPWTCFAISFILRPWTCLFFLYLRFLDILCLSFILGYWTCLSFIVLGPCNALSFLYPWIFVMSCSPLFLNFPHALSFLFHLCCFIISIKKDLFDVISPQLVFILILHRFNPVLRVKAIYA